MLCTKKETSCSLSNRRTTGALNNFQPVCGLKANAIDICFPFKDTSIFILCVQMLCLHVYMCTTCVLGVQMPEVLGFPTIRVTDSRGVPCECQELSPCPLQMQQGLLTSASSPHPSLTILKQTRNLVFLPVWAAVP